MQYLALILALLKAIPVVERLLKMFKKSPQDRQAEREERIDEGLKKAKDKDDTSGLFK